MTYQEFDERLQRLFEMNPQRERKLRDRWTRISRRGPLFYIATRGLLTCVWILALLWFFTSRFHTVTLLTRATLFASMFPEMIVIGFMLPAIAYVTVRGTVTLLDKRHQRLLRRNRTA